MNKSYDIVFNKFINLLLLLIAFLSPFEESCIKSISYFIHIVLCLIGFLTMFYVFFYQKFIITKNTLILFFLFIVPIFLSSIGMTYLQIFNPNGLYFKNLLIDTVGRLINYITLILFAYAVIVYKKYRFCNGFDNDSFIKIYWLGCFLALFFCFWQFISMYLGLIPFPFNTRDYVHSVSENIASIVPGRITGVLQEPSYLVPIIYDFVFLSYIYIKNSFKIPLIIISFFFLFLTFSGSAGFEFFLLIGVFYLYLSLSIICNKKYLLKLKRIIIWVGLSLGLFGIFFFIYKIQDGILMLFLTRLSNVTYSGRFKNFVLPFVLSYDSGIINLVFGHGIKSFLLLKETYNTYITSNSLYPDIFWEHGLIGLLGILIFTFSILKNYICKKLTNRRILIILFVLHFMIASLYRSDFASTRSFIIIMIITILCEKEKIRPFSINHNLKEVK